MTPSFDHLVKHLKNLGPFLFKPNAGNGGDAVIALATIQLFQKHNLEWQFYTPENYKTCKTLVYGGGGGLLKQYTAAANFISAHSHDVTSFTLLPHSVSGHDRLLETMDNRFHLFARETYTYQHLKQTASPAHIYLSHDLALNLDLSQLTLPEKTPFFMQGQPAHYNLHWLRRQCSLLSYFKQDNEIALFFRKDSEAKDSNLRHPNSIDLSHLVKGRLTNEIQIQAIATTFVSLINRCKHIKTDRLHIGIVAGLCQIPCDLYPGNNFKIEGIYEHSLKDSLETIRLHASEC